MGMSFAALWTSPRDKFRPVFLVFGDCRNFLHIDKLTYHAYNLASLFFFVIFVFGL